jgi:hypothetical protein
MLSVANTRPLVLTEIELRVVDVEVGFLAAREERNGNFDCLELLVVVVEEETKEEEEDDDDGK